MTEDASERPVALVTGGSRGIGRAIVLELATQGHNVGFCYRSEAKAAAEVERDAVSLGARILARPVDVTDGFGIQRFVEETEAELGPVQTAVSCAGITRDRHLVRMDQADWSTVLQTNLNGTYNLCRAVIFPMMKRQQGSIITISSAVGVRGNIAQANYAAAKAGIIGFTQSVAKECGRYGIRANIVAPGYIDTDMTTVLGGKTREAALAAIPLGRFGWPEEVAHLVAFLASPRAAYINGAVLSIDGGVVI
jgi:3-oxoacyl-[acyl-carrier protein] reductase